MPLHLNSQRRKLVLALLSGLACSSPALADTPLQEVRVEPIAHQTESVDSTTDAYAPVEEQLADLVADAGQDEVTEETADDHVVPEWSDSFDESTIAQTQYALPAYSSAPAHSSHGGSCNTCCSKEKKDALTKAMKGAYKGVFYANNYSYLNDPCYTGPHFLGDNLKGLANGKLDIGGQARVRYHSENNHRGLGLTGLDDEFFLTRLRLFANYRVNDYFRLYGEYLYADSAGELLPSRPIEENRGEIQNLFLDTNLTENLAVRVGRQELLFGAQRLISPLDWANTRRTFEGVRGFYQGEKWDIDGFFVHPVNRTPATQSTIDDADENEDFYGVYATRKGLDIGLVDAYYLGYNDSDNGFDYQTIGGRVAGARKDGLLYEVEAAVQFGENSPGFGDHSAGFFTGGIGRKHDFGKWKPTTWFWYDFASGGDDFPPARGDDGFDHLFPLGHKYNGFIDLFGRRNLHDINAQFITPLGDKVSLLIWVHQFFLVEDTTPYSLVLTPFNTTAPAEDRDLGQEIDILFNVKLNPRNNVLIGYSHFNAGAYYDETPGVPTDADADFFYVQYQTNF